MVKKCNECGFQQNEFLNLGGRKYCNGCNSEINNVSNSGSKLDSITLSAHDKMLIFDNLRYLLEGLEEYVEKKGYYPNFKRQFRNITLSKEQSRNLTVDSIEDFFKTNLLIFVAIIKDTPDFIAKGELRDEFYKWINVVGIDVNNCSDEKLKHFLVEINNVLEGNGEKIVNQTKEYLDDKKKVNPTSFEDDMEGVKKVFGAIQPYLNRSREQAKLLKDKTYRDAEIKDKIGGGNVEQGEQAFNRIAGNVVSKHDGFHFFKKNNPQQRTNSEIIQDVKNNPQNWRIDEIITEFDNFGTKKEIVLIHQSARLDDYDQRTNKLNFDGNLIYRAERFNQAEIAEINRALNISQTSTSTSSKQYFTVPSQKSAIDKSTKSNDNKDIRAGKVFGIVGIISILLIGSVVVIRKKMNKKLKK